MLNYCRLCLRNETLITNLITTDLKYSHLDILEFLYWIFDVEVNRNDPYSKSICQKCTNILQEVENYRETYKRCQLILRNKIDDLRTSTDTIDNNWISCDTLVKNGNKPAPTETQNTSIPIVSITKLENTTTFKEYEEINDLCYRKKQTINKDSTDWLTKSKCIGTSAEEKENGTIRVPVEVFQTCICPSLSISKLEDDIYREYEKVDNITYTKLPHKYNINPNHMKSEIKRMKFIEYYYRTPTRALQELIRNMYEGDTQKIEVRQKHLASHSCEPLIKIQGVRHVQVCNYCSESFPSKKLLVMHHKKQHKTIIIDEENTYRLIDKTKCKKSTSSTLPSNVNDNVQNGEFLKKIKCKWNSISDLINVQKKRETVASNSDYLFPNLHFMKEQNKNNGLRKNQESNITGSITHNSGENSHINLATEKTVIESNTVKECTSMPQAKSTNKKRKDISIIQNIVIQKNVEQDLGNGETSSPQNFIVDKGQSNENKAEYCQQKDTFTETEENGNPIVEDNISANKSPSKAQDLSSIQIAQYLWEKTINDIRAIQENKCEDQTHQNPNTTNISNIMFISQKDTDVIHNVNNVSKNQTFINNEDQLQLIIPSESNILETQIKDETDNTEYMSLDNLEKIHMEERQDNLPNLIVTEEQNDKNKTEDVDEESLKEEVIDFVDEEENNVFFFNSKGELDKSIQHNFSKVGENQNNTKTEVKQIIEHSQLQDLHSLLKKKDIINKLKKHMQINMMEQKSNSQNLTISRVSTSKNNDISIKNNKSRINPLKSTDEEISIIEYGKRSYEGTIEEDNNSIQPPLLTSPKTNCKLSESRAETENIQNSCNKELCKQSPEECNRTSVLNICTSNQPPKEIGFETFDKNMETKLDDQPYCKRPKLAKDIKTIHKGNVNSSNVLKNHKLSDIHDRPLENVVSERETNVKFNGSKKHVQCPKANLVSKSFNKRKNKSKKKAHTLCPQVEKRLSILFKRLDISSDHIADKIKITNDHSYATNICNKFDCIQDLVNSSPAKNSRCSPLVSPAPITNCVKKIKICKPCTVVVEKLDLKKEINHLSTIDISF